MAYTYSGELATEEGRVKYIFNGLVNGGVPARSAVGIIANCHRTTNSVKYPFFEWNIDTGPQAGGGIRGWLASSAISMAKKFNAGGNAVSILEEADRIAKSSGVKPLTKEAMKYMHEKMAGKPFPISPEIQIKDTIEDCKKDPKLLSGEYTPKEADNAFRHINNPGLDISKNHRWEDHGAEILKMLGLTEEQLGSYTGNVSNNSSVGNSSAGGMVAMAGVSKFWYLGAVHNIINNAQLEKLYLDVKLRGCNLSILRGEKIPMLIIDNKHKTNLAEPDAAHIDPTNMIDTWASGWFMIGGISYIYDPINNNNANKWTTQMKLQRMEWPTPTEIMDPSSKNARILRYNLAEGMAGFNIDGGVTVEGTSINDVWQSKEIVIGTGGLDQSLKQLIELFDRYNIPYKLASARRYPIDEFGNIVKEKKAATVKFAGSYAFKCADNVRFFRNPISDHSWGQGIDIVQADGANFNTLLADIVSNDDILIHMYKNGLSLYEEEALDDLGLANSHFHIGTNINLPSTRDDNDDANKIGDNWWNSIIALKETSILRGYSLKMWKKNKKQKVTVAPAQEWELKKFFNSDANWQSKSFGKYQLSYDDWIMKVQNNIKRDVNRGTSEKSDIKYDFNENKITELTTPSEALSVPQTDDPNVYVPSIPRDASPTTVNAITTETNTYNNFKISAKELYNEDVWDNLSGECLENYRALEQLFNNYIKIDKMTVADEHFQDAVAHLSVSMGKIKVIMDNVSTNELLIQKGEDTSRILQKRFNLDTVYYNSKKLLDDIEKYMQKYNADYIRSLGENGSNVEIDPETGGMKVNLLSTSNAQMRSLESIMKDVEKLNKAYAIESQKIENYIRYYTINTEQWKNKDIWHGNTDKYPTIQEFFADFIKTSGISPNHILVCDTIQRIGAGWTEFPINYVTHWAKGGTAYTSEGNLSTGQDTVLDVYIYDDPELSSINSKKWERWVDKNDLSSDKKLFFSWTMDHKIKTSLLFYSTYQTFDETFNEAISKDIDKYLEDLFGWFENSKKIFPWWTAKYRKLLERGDFNNITQENWYRSDLYNLWIDGKSRIPNFENL